MKRAGTALLRHKAASAAFAVLCLSVSWAAASTFTLPQPHNPDYPFSELPQVQTLPAIPDEERGFRELEFAFHWQQAQTPLLAKDFLEQYPASEYAPYVRLMLGDWYFYNKEYSLALRQYKALSRNAFDGDIRYGLLYREGFALVKTGFYREARSLFRKTVYSRTYGNASRFYLAYVDYVEGNYDAAYDAFKKHDSPEADYYLNQIDFLRGEYRNVAKTSDRLLKGNVPEEMLLETMRVGGLSYFKLGDSPSARRILSQYVTLAGDGAEYSALYALGCIYYDEGDYVKALPLFTSVTESDGALAQSAWLYIGQIMVRQGDTQAAALAFEKAAKQGWDSEVGETGAYNYAVGSAIGSSLPFADSARAMVNFIDSYPDSKYAKELSGYLANAYYNLRNYDEALRQIDKISHPDASTKAIRQKILYQLGSQELREGKLTPAIRHLSDASGPDKAVGAQAALWLGEAYYANKDYRKAAQAYSEAIASATLAENTALANYNLGYSYMKLRDYRKAEAAFKKAIALKGLTPQQLSDARLREADCMYYTGNYEGALAIYRDIKLNGGQDGVYAQLRESDILGRNGKVSEKIAILERLADSEDAGIWRATVLSRLADTYSEQGQDRKAAELYARMLDNTGGAGSEQTYYALAYNADNLYNSGDREAALSAYRRIEKAGIEDLYPAAALGIARTSSDKAEVAHFAEVAASLSGLTADEMNEARFLGAEARLQLGGARKEEAKAALLSLAGSSDRLWGARAAVLLGETLLAEGNAEGAEEVLTALIDNGSSSDYWLARGYITLADVYTAQGKDYLARLYVESLRDNYPGNEKDIRQMINSRLK